MTECITILGSTGSIGKNTLNVISQHRESFEIYALTAYSQVDLLFEQIQAFQPRYAVIVNEKYYQELNHKVQSLGLSTEVLTGSQALIEVSTDTSVNTVMAAIVGSAGLKPTYEAAKKGKRILLANKETLVASGQLFIDAVNKSQAELIPVDSEHNAIFQCLPEKSKQFSPETMHSIVLTASGGPLRHRALDELENVTVAEAVAHPNWSMGAKISVDSATMVNKALEMIEAHWLFGVPHTHLKVLIHPQSIIHSMVHYKDGSYLAQIGSQDMKTPIANALFYPKRMHTKVEALNIFEKALTFEPVDYQRFPSVKLMYQILASNDCSFYATVFNAVNEVLVDQFLSGHIAFTDITLGIERALDSFAPISINQIEDVFEIDSKARQWVQSENFTLIQSKD
ncbi:1-deoxy-D-xylulose-5-phosphate reductoisomerase [Thiotrichales bacterium 19S11-10]|nr:1-deoxy-D-xylulose-5-phosphate reductoisomerase [Thiotrichales bacterium 19S11-10]